MSRKVLTTELRQLSIGDVRHTVDHHSRQLRTWDDDGTEIEIKFTWSKSTFGYRPWFVCPQCERRCAILYGSAHVCRLCAGVAYPSEYESGFVKSLRRRGASAAEIMVAQLERFEAAEERRAEREGRKLIW